MSKPLYPVWTPGAIGTEGCLGYWLLHEGSGGIVADISPNGHHGTIVGPTWATGDYGPALSWGAEGDRLTTPSTIAGLTTWTVALSFTQRTAGHGTTYGRLWAGSVDLPLRLTNENRPERQSLVVGSVVYTVDLGITAGGTHALVISCDGVTLRTVRDGLLVRSQAAPPAISASAGTLIWGNNSAGDRTADYLLHSCGLWSVGYSEADSIALSLDFAGTFAAAGGGSAPTRVYFPAALLMG